MPKVIGITGGIASGKSTVLRLFGELGARVLSADDLARDVLAKGGPAHREAIERFGEGIVGLDGEIDRPTLGGIVFSDPTARADLNAITHPHIISAMQRGIDDFRSTPQEPGAVLAVEIPLLIECGLEGMVDEVVVVAAEPETQQSRLTSRSGLSAEQARQRIAAQIPIEHKVERADRVIWNNGSLEDLRALVHAAWDEMHLL